jgi:putative flippase GtrA
VEAAVEAGPARIGLVSQLFRFVVVGGLAAVVDYGTYQLLLHLGLNQSFWVSVAKGCSFILGTTTAYLLNKRWTFNVQDSATSIAQFALLYVTTFFVNVGMNALSLHVLPEFSWKVSLAWVIAQGTATTINFLVLRLVIWRHA